MPTVATSKWPRPKSEDEWEDMALDALRIRWDDPNAQRFGRRGQNQDGIDIIGVRGKNTVGAQIKNIDKITESTVRKEIKSIEGSNFKFEEIYFVIGGNRDTKQLELIKGISDEQKKKGSFSIFILFFEDVTHELSQKRSLINKYWADFLISISEFFVNRKITTSDEAINQIEKTKEFQNLLVTLSGGKVGISLRIESYPNLECDKLGSTERSWQIAIAESHDNYLVTLIRIAIDVDDGSIKIYDLSEDEWVSQNEWINRGHSIFRY